MRGMVGRGWGCAALVAALTATLAGAQSPQFKETTCSAAFGRIDDSLNTIAHCGTVSVAQDRSRPTDATLQKVVLPVVKFAAPDAQGTPLVFLAGGPGESAVDALQQVVLRTSFGKLMLRERPVIAFDHRGIVVNPDRGLTSLGTAPLMQRLPRLMGVPVLRDSVARIAKQLRAQGIEPRNFTTLGAVDDIADVVHAMGYSKIILVGVSYGTRDAMHFMHRHPEMIESVILDAVAPPSAKELLDSTTIVHAGLGVISRIVEDCRHDPDCAGEYGDLPNAVARLVSDTVTGLQRTANFGDNNGGWRTIKVNSLAVLSILGLVAASEPIRAETPRVLLEFASQDTLRSELSTRVLVAAAADPTLVSSSPGRVPMIRYVTLCSDRPQGEPYAGDRTLCDAIGVPFGGSEATARVASTLPTLLISSGYDAQTPPEFAVDALRSLPRGHRVYFPMVGHVALGRPVAMACVAIVIDSFIARPDRAPASDCISSVLPAFVPRGVMTPGRAP